MRMVSEKLWKKKIKNTNSGFKFAINLCKNGKRKKKKIVIAIKRLCDKKLCASIYKAPNWGSVLFCSIEKMNKRKKCISICT